MQTLRRSYSLSDLSESDIMEQRMLVDEADQATVVHRKQSAGGRKTRPQSMRSSSGGSGGGGAKETESMTFSETDASGPRKKLATRKDFK